MRPDRGLRKPTEYLTLAAGGAPAAGLKATLLDDQPGLEGYLTLTYVLADRGLFFLPGAFKKTAREQLHRTFHLWQHWPDLVLGKHVSAVEDETGFRVAVQINEDKDLGREIMSDYRFGIPYAWSVGFTAIRDRSGRESDEAKLDRRFVPPSLKGVPITELRAIEEARWFESSTVTWGSIENAGPDVVQAKEFDADMVSALIEALTNGTATPGQLANAERIANAWRDRAAAGGSEPHHGTRHEGDGDATALEQSQPRRTLIEIRAAQARITALVARGHAA